MTISQVSSKVQKNYFKKLHETIFMKFELLKLKIMNNNYCNKNLNKSYILKVYYQKI